MICETVESKQFFVESSKQLIVVLFPFFITLAIPKIDCAQLHSNFNINIVILCHLSSRPIASIILNFTPNTITSYEMLLIAENFTEQYNIETTYQYKIIFTPTISMDNTKIVVYTTFLDMIDHNTINMSIVNQLLSHFVIKLKYDDFLTIKCSDVYIIENNFGFKCTVKNISDVTFDVKIPNNNNKPKLVIKSIGYLEMQLEYRIKSDINLLNKTFKVKAMSPKTGNSIQTTVKITLQEKLAKPINVTFLVNDNVYDSFHLKCKDLSIPYNISCSAYSFIQNYKIYILSPNGTVYNNGYTIQHFDHIYFFGLWTCYATNNNGKSDEIYIDIALEDIPCNLNLTLTSKTIVNNDSTILFVHLHKIVNIQCIALSFPIPLLYSLSQIDYKNSIKSSLFSYNGNFKLDIKNKLLSGIWRCTIFNSFGHIHSNEIILVVTENDSNNRLRKHVLHIINGMIMLISVLIFILIYITIYPYIYNE